jgi:dTDP-4-amino-4,6-dideoxy-D-galactose acyltransferase
MSELCRLLTWDSNFFGKRIARVVPTSVTHEQLTMALEWGRRNRVQCLYFLCGANDGPSIRRAEQHKFHLVDFRVTMERPIVAGFCVNSPSSGIEIRPAHAQDISPLRKIAEVSHRDSRFYSDPEFDGGRCDALYGDWIEKSCGGWADVVLVACVDGSQAGYISCHRENHKAGRIGLMAVAAKARGRGVGRQLLNASLAWFAQHDLTRVSVVTQGKNFGAQRLYQQGGFFTQLVQIWYHHWEQRQVNHPFIRWNSRDYEYTANSL